MDKQKTQELSKLYADMEKIKAAQDVNDMRHDNASDTFSVHVAIETAKKGKENFRKTMDSIDMDDIVNG